MCRTSARQFRMQWSSARLPRPVDFRRAIHRQRRRVLDLDPVRASAATIGAISPLRDQPSSPILQAARNRSGPISTAALGGHVARCEECAHSQISYNTCRNRHCPKCQGAAAKDWLAAREADLLPVPYYHVVFTLPTAIADIAYQNKAVIYDLLFKASAETLTTIAADPRHLGARIGITSVLHSWGSAMTHHPHVHMIVPGGGISLDGE